MSMPPAVQRQIVDLFDETADTYERVDGVDFFRPIADGLLEQLAPQAGERALDIGCGTGALLIPLARAVAPNGRAIGIDAAPTMVARSDEEAAAAGVNVEVLVGDAQAPDFPPASLDVVGSSLVLFFLADPVAALAAWRELLIDAGRVGISTFGPFSEPWRSVEAVFNAFLPPTDANPRAPAAANPFASDEGVEQLLAAAGSEGCAPWAPRSAFASTTSTSGSGGAARTANCDAGRLSHPNACPRSAPRPRLPSNRPAMPAAGWASTSTSATRSPAADRSPRLVPPQSGVAAISTPGMSHRPTSSPSLRHATRRRTMA